jgi:hypothetical protein
MFTDQSRRITGALVVFGLLIAGCGKSSSDSGSAGAQSAPSEDISASGIAASAVGGTLLLSEPSVWPPNSCPNIRTANGSGCDTASPGSIYLTYKSCTFPGSTSVFNGVNALFTTLGTLNCGSFPQLGDDTPLGHQFAGTVTSASGTVVTVSATHDNYTGTNRGDVGEVALFSGNQRVTANIYAMKFVATGKFNYTVVQHDGMGLRINSSGSASTLNGRLFVHHNLERVTGTTQFKNVLYKTGCCQPLSGTITTDFLVSINGNENSSLNHTHEKMTFDGICGQATLTDVKGNSSTVILPFCL